MLLSKQLLNTANGFWGEFGGSYVPEAIRTNTDALAAGFAKLAGRKKFREELAHVQQQLVGRPTPLTPLTRLSKELGGATLWLKNEGLLHTGAHKVNHVVGQLLVAKHLGRKRIVAETGAGQHGLATASLCARFGMPATIYMGHKDYLRQRPNVFWMEQMGATVVSVQSGDQTLNSAVTAAMQDLLAHPDDTHYLIGTVVGPHPYPLMNAYFQRVISEEIQAQLQHAADAQPTAVLACVGGGSNALGAFFAFLDDPAVALIGVEAGGKGSGYGQHAARMLDPTPGVYEGYASYFLQDEDGNIAPTQSVSAGLDYCGISPILAWLHQQKRVQFATANDEAVLAAWQRLARTEGILLALESTHALAEAFRIAPQFSPSQHLVINGSGRAEKDLFILMEQLQPQELADYFRLKLKTLPEPEYEFA